MLTIVEVEQLSSNCLVYQLRRGKPCEEHGVWVCPKVLEIGIPKNAETRSELAIRFCLPNEKHWARWRKEADSILERVISDFSSVNALEQHLNTLAETKEDSTAMWHWTTFEQRPSFEENKSNYEAQLDEVKSSLFDQLCVVLKKNLTFLGLGLIVFLLWLIDYLGLSG